MCSAPLSFAWHKGQDVLTVDSFSCPCRAGPLHQQIPSAGHSSTGFLSAYPDLLQLCSCSPGHRRTHPSASVTGSLSPYSVNYSQNSKQDKTFLELSCYIPFSTVLFLHITMVHTHLYPPKVSTQTSGKKAHERKGVPDNSITCSPPEVALRAS